MSLDALITSLRQHKGLAHKQDINGVIRILGKQGFAAQEAWIGDDCAVIPHGASNLLLAIEGFINEFVAHDAWFAGWCGVMVNLSDIAAMGGRPLAVVDALWSAGDAQAAALMEGLQAAARTYGVPIVGGHTNTRCQQGQLAVAILGEAKVQLSSFAARPGDCLVAVIDLRGAYREPFDNWDAATSAPAERLRSDLALLPAIAESGLAHAAKDISQAGLLGTTLMLMECSGVGARLELSAVPRPAEIDLARWLRSFPSFGYLLACPAASVAPLLAQFEARGLAAAEIGKFNASQRLEVTLDGAAGEEDGVFWDLGNERLMGIDRHAIGSHHADY
ncbi:sll0787 family AIR synthase-like protein [Dechloromonas hortensis]|uniref:sll0787 family AIR synthase-like protein n=1 Tax=Dechloromonas hortensis TaxID=337779 RepID=UPI0012929068|nr:sll0787 family AIR synthase-like protein [Dechloromonas hortensis]